MSIILRLQNLPWAANSLDIRRYFQNLSIPEGGVHIVGGDKGDAFIAFTTDEDARQAMERDGGKVKDCKIKLMLSSRVEMQRVIELARSVPVQLPALTPPVSKPKEKDRSRSPDRSKRSSPEKRRDREKSPRDRDRNRKSSSSRKDKSRSRSPAKRSRDKERDRDSDRRSKRSDDRRKSDDVSKSRDESSRHNSVDSRSASSAPQAASGNGIAGGFGLTMRQTDIPPSRMAETSFASSFNQMKPLQQSIDPWIDKTALWEESRKGIIGGTNQDMFRPNIQQAFQERDPFGRKVESMNSLNAFSRPKEDIERPRFGLPPAFESAGSQRRPEPYTDNGVPFSKLSEDSMGKPLRAFDSDQRIPPVPQMGGLNHRQAFEEPGYNSSPSRGMGFCVEVRGLPYSVSYKDIRDLFRGVFITNDGLKLINDETGQRTGTAVMRLTNQRDVNEALKRNKQYVGDNYIDVFRCTDNVFEQAIDSYLPVGVKKPVHFQPRPDDLVVMLKGLPFMIKEDDIIHFFDGLRILDIHIENDLNGRTTGCGFVEFGTLDDFHAAMAMNRRTIGHRYIDLSISSKDIMFASRNQKAPLENRGGLSLMERDRQSGNKDLLPIPQAETRPSYCVALQGLPFSVTDRLINEFFSDVGIPLTIHIMLNQERLPNGEAFVEFNARQQYEAALSKNGMFIGQNAIKVLSIQYDDMMDLLGTTVGRGEPLLNRPMNDSRGKGLTDDQDIMARPVMGNNRPRPGLRSREIDEPPNIQRMGDSRNFYGGIRDAPSRGFPRESHEAPVRNFSDVLDYRDNRDGPPPRDFSGESRHYGGRPLMDGPQRPRGYMGDNQERPIRHGARPDSDGFDDSGRNRRMGLPEEIGMDMTESPDSRGRGPMERPSDMKGGGRHILDTPQNRTAEDMPGSRDFGPEGRMNRGPPPNSRPPPPDRRRMLPPPGGAPAPVVPEGFGKPGCVVAASNISFRATVDEILAVFKDYSLTKENVVRRFDNLGRVTGDARLSFNTPEEAKKAVAELNGKTISGRPVSLFMT